MHAWMCVHARIHLYFCGLRTTRSAYRNDFRILRKDARKTRDFQAEEITWTLQINVSSADQTVTFTSASHPAQPVYSTRARVWRKLNCTTNKSRLRIMCDVQCAIYDVSLYSWNCNLTDYLIRDLIKRADCKCEND